MITDLLNEYGVEYIDSGPNVGKEWIGCKCPLHNDPSFHLGFNLDGNWWSCWSCGSISAYDLLKEWGIPYEAYTAIAGNSYVAKQKRLKVHGKLKYPTGWVPNLLEIHKDYLR